MISEPEQVGNPDDQRNYEFAVWKTTSKEPESHSVQRQELGEAKARHYKNRAAEGGMVGYLISMWNTRAKGP